MSEHDPFNEPETAHPRARELMVEDFFWDCVDELAPFGSDEGHDAYFEWQEWRRENEDKDLIDCLAWILEDRMHEYTQVLLPENMDKAASSPDDAFMSDKWDVFTLDTTIIATALGQLLDEGQIDEKAKPYVYVAIDRQLDNRFGGVGERRERMLATRRVVDEA